MNIGNQPVIQFCGTGASVESVTREKLRARCTPLTLRVSAAHRGRFWAHALVIKMQFHWRPVGVFALHCGHSADMGASIKRERPNH